MNFIDLKKDFSRDGFFICKNIFDNVFITQLIDEINSSKGAIKYFDKSNNLRRIEKLFDKGNQLKNEEFLIFKDKYNAKPAGGDGFFAHYDGIFHFIDPDNNKKNGWYEYGDFFINALVALDDCNKENGTIELARSHKGSFKELLKNTKNDGTPALTKQVELDTSFNLINLNIGDMVIFSNTCPHRSKKNDSDKSRRILYYTYSLSKSGSKYQEYFDDKAKSKNKSKALVEK